jgi:hypothetical protein
MAVMLSSRAKLVDGFGAITREWFSLISDLVNTANGGGVFSVDIGSQIDLAKRNWTVTMSADGTLLNPKNALVGQSGFIVITQNATLAKTLAFGTFWRFDSGVAPTISAGLGDVDVLRYSVINSNYAACTYINNVS